MSPTDAPPEEPLTLEEIREGWSLFDAEERVEAFKQLVRSDAEDFFLDLTASEQAVLVQGLLPTERRSWLRLLAPDDAADLLQEVPSDQRPGLIALLDDVTQKDVTGLLVFAEDDAGGLMNPRYARLRPDIGVDEAISYLRKLARERLGTIYYAYVLDPEMHLLGAVSLRELFAATPEKLVRDVMQTEVIKADEQMDQEQLARLFAQHDLVAVPIIDAENRMKGIVTIDDIVDVVREEATEDIQHIGGTEALDEPYMTARFGNMVQKRAGWLAALFIGELFTATAMQSYQDELTNAPVLMNFLPLIISSGGNSGSQATTLVIRAMALGEVKLKDWWRVIRREIASGFALGAILAPIGVIRILIWQALGWSKYGPHYGRVATSVGLSVIGIVTWGTIAGSMLPFILRKLGFDPARASAPFVATLVDVSGLIIYFTISKIVLTGTLL